MTFSPAFTSGFAEPVVELEFGGEFGGEYSRPPTVTQSRTQLAVERLECPEVEILTGVDVVALSGTETLADYLDLEQSEATYALVASNNATYADLMYGHAGHPGGSPAPGSGGLGVHLGIRDLNSVEWWITDLEGWESGPDVSPVEVESMIPGTWIDRVRGKGREVTLRGTVFSPTLALVDDTKRRLAACLATSPHFGVLRVGGIGGLTLPVALVSPAKIKHLADTVVEFEATVKGHNVGTVGAGVWREGSESEYVLDAAGSEVIPVTSYIATRPTIRLVGAFSIGWKISDGERKIELATALTASDILLIDCATWRVSLNGAPARYMLTADSGRLEVSPSGSTLTTTGTGTGKARVTVTDIY